MERIKRVICAELKDVQLAENRGSGAAAAMGNMDRQGDVIFPGAFRKCIKAFLASGFVADSHDWEWEGVCAMPVSMREQGNLLMTEWEFHGDEDSQALRTKCAERVARGLSVGLSIGFCCSEGAAWFETGAGLLKYAEGLGADMSLFDAKGIKAWQAYCRAITEVDELYEYSLVPVPANPRAVAMSVKSAGDIETERDFERFLRDAGYSRTRAAAIALHGYKAAHQRDAEPNAPDIIQPDVEGLRARALRLRATLTGA
jgi:hypothetical protein